MVGRWHVLMLNIIIILSVIIILSCYGFITLCTSPTIVLFSGRGSPCLINDVMNCCNANFNCALIRQLVSEASCH